MRRFENIRARALSPSTVGLKIHDTEYVLTALDLFEIRLQIFGAERAMEWWDRENTKASRA